MLFHSGGKQNTQAINLDMELRIFPDKTSCPNSKMLEEKDKLKKGLLDKKEPALTIWKVQCQSRLQRMKKQGNSSCRQVCGERGLRMWLKNLLQKRLGR